MEPCFDGDGNPTDGSVHLPWPNEICISRGTLGQKLKASDAVAQTTALVAHEYFHLIGLSEQQATALQEKVLNAFSVTPIWMATVALANREGMAKKLITHIESFLDSSNDVSWNTICPLAEKIDSSLQSLSEIEKMDSFVSVHDNAARKKSRSYELKAISLVMGACGKSDYHPARKEFTQTHETYFQRRTQISDILLAQLIWNDSSIVQGNIWIKKINTINNAIAEIKSLKDFLKEDFLNSRTISGLNADPY